MARNQSRLVLVFLLCVALHPLWRQCGPQHVPFRRQAFIGTRAAGGGVPAKRSSIAKLAAAASDQTKQSPESIWVRVKGGEPVEYTTENLRNVGDLLKAVKTEENLSVGTGRLKLYASKEAYDKKDKALRGDEKIANLPSSVTYDNPFHVAYEEPKIGGAGVSEALRPRSDDGVLEAPELEGMTVQRLRKMCKANGLPVNGTKNVLVQRIRDHEAANGLIMPPVTLGERTRKELQGLCKDLGFPTSGKKQRLIELIKSADRTVFFQDFVEQHQDDIVPLDGPWAELCKLLEKPRGLLLRAAPQTGKTTLGRAAAVLRQRFLLDEKNWTIEYYASKSDFLNRHHGNPAEAACYSAEMCVIFYVDEAQGNVPGGSNQNIDDALVSEFFKSPRGRAVFVSPVRNPFGGNVTPPQIVQNTVIYTRPGNATVVLNWLQGRLDALVMDQSKAVADLLMELSGGHIGILQHLGLGIQANRMCRHLAAVKGHLKNHGLALPTLGEARCFGIQNGGPTPEEAKVISMLRCTGKARRMDPDDEDQPGFNPDEASLRQGFNKALYAPVPRETGRALTALEDANVVGFVHPLQPEMYHLAFLQKRWPGMSLEERWVTDFSGKDGPPSQRPQHVVDLVLSWLSHVNTTTLLDVKVSDKAGNIDAQERSLDSSLSHFLQAELGLRGGGEDYTNQYRVAGSKDGNGVLDFLITGCKDRMGVELLIRASSENKQQVTPASVLDAGKNRKYFMEHVVRTCATLAKDYGQESYENTSAECDSGYVTVLIATSGQAALDKEFAHFMDFINSTKGSFEKKGALDKLRHVMAALAPPGWAEFDVFHYDPDKQDCKRYHIQRQRLMYKRVDDVAVTARHFYPRPTEVWAQELVREGEKLELRGDAFKVKPEDDDVASLAQGIAVLKGYVDTSGSQLAMYSQNRIYSQNRAEEWQKLEKNQRLYENLFERPYGFVVPGSGA